jgi:hypothetical protein
MKLRGEEIGFHLSTSGWVKEPPRHDEPPRRSRDQDDLRHKRQVTLVDTSVDDLMAEMRIREDEEYSR